MVNPERLFCQPRQPQKRRMTMPDRPTVTQRRSFSGMMDRLVETQCPYSGDPALDCPAVAVWRAPYRKGRKA